MRIVILEDEKLTARDLARTIKSIDKDIEILPFLYSVEEAKMFFKQTISVDLIFSDIELGDGLSFEVFEELKIKIPVIFCTAYEEYVLKAFKSYGIDYIVKPFQKTQIEQALIKYQTLKSNFSKPAIDFSDLTNIINHRETASQKSILVYQGEKIIPVAAEQIELFYIKNGKVFTHVNLNEEYLISETLDELESRFPHFFRANRQFLLSRKSVKDASQYFNRKLLVNLRFPFQEEIVISRLKVSEFLEWLANQSNL